MIFYFFSICRFSCSISIFINFLFVARHPGLPSTKLHTLLLDHKDTKLTWYIDWPRKEVLFNVERAFDDDDDTKWFSFGFSKRGELEASDLCFFVRNSIDDEKGFAIVRRLAGALSNFVIELTVSRPFRRTHISVMMGKSSKIISKIVSCCASKTNRLRSNANSIHAIHKTFTCTKARCICCGHVARKSSHFPWTTK